MFWVSILLSLVVVLQTRKMAIESAGKVELPQPEEGRFMVRDVLCFVCSCNLFVFPLSILLSLVVVMQRRKRAVEGTAEE